VAILDSSGFDRRRACAPDSRRPETARHSYPGPDARLGETLEGRLCLSCRGQPGRRFLGPGADAAYPARRGGPSGQGNSSKHHQTRPGRTQTQNVERRRRLSVPQPRLYALRPIPRQWLADCQRPRRGRVQEPDQSPYGAFRHALDRADGRGARPAPSHLSLRRLRCLLGIPHPTGPVPPIPRLDRGSKVATPPRIMEHLLKLQLTEGPMLALNCRLWQASITRHRIHIEVLLADSPSLRRKLRGMMPAAYRRAVRIAKPIAVKPIPTECPFTLEQLLSDDERV